MNFTSHPLSLLGALALGWFVRGAATPADPATMAALPKLVLTFPVSGHDASVPPASTVAFPAVEDAAAPTF